jgi:1,4-dihydroxy-2-naphthoate octaprenyltransferase
MIAAWTYTGGPRPYGYAGLGEIFVFVFFGVVATVGSQFVVSQSATAVSLVASIAVGTLSCALLVVNNLRDIDGDALVGKRTLAVKMGEKATRYFFALLFVIASISVITVAVMTQAWALLGLLGIAAGLPAVMSVLRGTEKSGLIVVLGQVGRAQLIFGVVFSLGLFISI